MLLSTYPCFSAVGCTYHPSSEPGLSDPPPDSLPSPSPPSREPLRLSIVLLTHKDGLAIYHGRVLVQGQGVCGQLLGLTAFRLRKTMNKKKHKKGARGWLLV